MDKKSLSFVVTLVGGFLILASLILPWSTRISVSPVQVKESSPFRSLVLLGGASLGITIIILSFITRVRSSIQTFYWGLSLIITILALLFFLFWLIMILTNPFGSPPGGSMSDVGLGVYTGLVGALIALSGLLLYKI
ncbi:MAG: hypothetical protein FJ044_04690 [Candidatus Cloacimonetes bacterium]|nr:hypothetical protein [Candidatus Cloacimonadota bacterium]